jgi:phosphoglucosamine mutase
MISASHNPFEDNGIKFFNQDGYKLTDQTEEEIERLMDAEEDTIIRPSGAALGKITSGNQYQEIYSNHLKTTVTTSFNGLKIILDCANGASTPIAPVIFKELGAEVIAIGNEPDGININVSCGSTHPENLQARVVAENADIGLAFDGDADRLIAVDHLGNMIDGDQILYVLSKRMKKNGTLKNNTVVSTVMSNFGFKKALDAENISNVQTGVGDRYVLEEMKKNKFVIGGEQSGHIILLDYNTTGDGVLSAIQLVATLVEEEKSLNELVSSFKKYPQVLINVKVSDKRGWETNQKINDTIIKFEEKLNGNGRILVRASGTENLIRVMAEGETEDIVYEIVNGISRIVEEELNHVNERS